VLAGLSAGAMCWFEGGITMSVGAPEAAPGLGLLTGSMSVHLDGEPERLPAYRAAVAAGLLPAGYAVDDCAALLFAGTELERCVSSRPGARVLRVAADGAGGTTLAGLSVEPLPGFGSHSGESDGVSELRALRLGRHRWD
jgi:dipeptidase E